MKKIAWLLLVASALSCGNQGASPLRLTSAFPLTEECKADKDVSQYSGSFDVAAAQQVGSSFAMSYLLSFTVGSDLTASKVTANGQTLDDGSRNVIFADEIVFNYSSEPALSFEEEVVPMHSAVEPGSDDNQFLIDLLAPKAATTLFTSMNPGDQTLLNVEFWLRGTVDGRERVESNHVTYPIHFYNSGVICPSPALISTGPCGALGGQDGTFRCLDAGT